MYFIFFVKHTLNPASLEDEEINEGYDDGVVLGAGRRFEPWERGGAEAGGSDLVGPGPPLRLWSHRWIRSPRSLGTHREFKTLRQELYVFLCYFECFNGTLGCNNSVHLTYTGNY